MHYHFIGICGVSMSGIAKLLKARGHKVTGSDLNYCEIISQKAKSEKRKAKNNSSKLKTENIKIYKNHNVQNITKDIDLVVRSSAVTPGSPGWIEVEAAQKLGIKVIKRSQLIGQLLRDKISIGVTGMHGKSTTSSMIATILEQAKLHPTILVGAEVRNIGTTTKPGRPVAPLLDKKDKPIFVSGGTIKNRKVEYVVAEACEYDRSFLDFKPKIGVITNIEPEHLDYYKGGLSEIKQAFKKFIRQLPKDGLLVVWQEDKNLMPLTKAAKCKVKRASINKPWPGLKLKIPGKHNLLDATFAARVCHELGVSHKIIKKSLNNFLGTGRRFEIKGEKKGILVVDDYGHHPTEIKATIEAAKEFMNDELRIMNYESEKKSRVQNPKKLTEAKKLTNLIMVFQPHQQQRTKILFNDFVKSFDGVDELIITDVYLIAGREKDTGENLAKKLTEEIGKRSINVKYIKSDDGYKKIVDYLKKNTKKGDLIITQGATDIYKAGEELLKFKSTNVCKCHKWIR